MNTAQLIDLAELALGGYGQFNQAGPPAEDRLTTLNGDQYGFASTQATRFSRRFDVALPTFSDATSAGGSGTTSFDVTVFKSASAESSTQVFISFRGYQQQNILDTTSDVQAVNEIRFYGAAVSQIIQMHNWWQRVSMPKGLSVPQFAPGSGANIVTRIADAVATGEVADLFEQTPGARVTVTGSSLGGHLAMAFAGLFPANIDGAIAFNSPGFGNDSRVQALFSALRGTVPAVGDTLITNVVSSEANNAGDALNLIAGHGGFPGLKLTLPIENQYSTDVPDPKVPSYNHDQRQVTDALAVYDLLQRLDKTLTLTGFGDLLRAAASGENRSLENLVDAVEILLGINKVALDAGNGNRNALYGAIQAIVGGSPLQSPEPNAVFLSLYGKVALKPIDSTVRGMSRSNFQAFVALQTLTPFVFNPIGAEGQTALDNLWQSAAWSATHQEWEADNLALQSGGQAVNFTNRYLDDRAAMLALVIKRNTDNVAGILPGNTNIRYFDAASTTELLIGAGATNDQRIQYLFGADGTDVLEGKGFADHLYGGAGDDLIDAKGGKDYVEGNAGDDDLYGGEGNDQLLGGTGDDGLSGEGGNDSLLGGAGIDTYRFDNNFGKDNVTDSDGQGTIEIDNRTIGAAKGVGKRDVWTADLGSGQYAGLAVYNDTHSTTGKRLVITRAGDTANTITIDNFDLAAAQGPQGYLGIKLDGIRIAIQEGKGATPWADLAFSPTSLAGQASTVVEGNTQWFTVYLNEAAQSGDTITLHLSNLTDKFQAFVGTALLPADNAVVTLAQGETEVSFALIQTGPVAADGNLQLSASFAGASSNATSNAWGVNLHDAGPVTRTYNGDQRAALAPGGDGGSDEHYDWGSTTWNTTTGVLNGGTGQQNFGDVIYAAAGSFNDSIDGKGGNDALDGGAGNDEIQGGDGDDLIAGGTGNDKIYGGTGNDYITSSGSLTVAQRYGPGDSWAPPSAAQVLSQGPLWGAYRLATAGDALSVVVDGWDVPVGADGDFVDAGVGNDVVLASAGDDHVLGGAGDDMIEGLAGNDVLEGGGGNDTIHADGTVTVGHFNSVAGAFHGDDFVDGGAGSDNLQGGGGDDAVYGGADNDAMWGDGAGLTGDATYLALTYHGNDYLDGGDGNDTIEGGARDDTLYGGANNDILWGDTSAVSVTVPTHNALMWGNDYLYGDEGDDLLFGGGGDDDLYGGIGNDQLVGDEHDAALGGEFNGSDYLDGGDGNDVLLGGGKDDILYGGIGNDSLLGDDDLSIVASAFQGEDYLDGEDGNDYLDGGAADDILIGGSGNDTLIGGTGADYMEGGEGADQYLVDDAGDVVFEADSDGNDSMSFLGGGEGVPANAGTAGSIDAVESSVSFSLGANLENLTLTGNRTIDGTGNELDNLLFGNAAANALFGGDGNDQLSGGGGADSLSGGAGDDVYVVDSADDQVIEAAGEGMDSVVTAVTLTLAENVESVQASGSAAINLSGNGLGNSLVGNAGGNVLAGGAGNDYLQGGAGNDQYVFNRADGSDSIDNTDFLSDAANAALPGATDVLRFGAGIAVADVVGLRAGDDLVLRLRASSDAVRVLGHYAPNALVGTVTLDHRIDRVEFAGSTVVWDQAAIQAVAALGATNHAPVVAANVPTLQARAGEGFSYVVPAGTIIDTDALDSVRYSVLMPDGTAVPAWLGFDAATRTLSGTPAQADAGTLQLQLRGTDDYGASINMLVGLRVREPNHVPQLLTALADQTAIQSATFSYTVPAGAFTDADPEDTLSYSATLVDGSPLPAWLGFNPATRSFGGTPAAVGTISVQVRATDPSNASAWDTFDIVVAPRPNHAPVLVSPLQDVSFFKASGFAFSYTVPVGAFADPDAGDTLTYGAALSDGSALPSWLSFDPDYRRFSGGPPGAGTTSVRVTASDAGLLSAYDDFSIVVQQAEYFGTGANDLIVGGSYDDIIWGYAGNDSLEGRYGSDELHGGDGADLLDGGNGDDTLDGGTGADSLVGGNNDDVLQGGAGDDTLVGDNGSDTYLFGPGDGHDVINGSNLSFDGQTNTLQFTGNINRGDVVLERGVYGVLDNLIITINATGDSIFIPEFFDNSAAHLYYPEGAFNDVQQFAFADGEIWTHERILAEFFTGTAGNDVIYGTRQAEVMRGGAGADDLHGVSGADSVYGESGHDRVVGSALLDGGSGNDTLIGDQFSDLYDGVLVGGTGNDFLVIMKGSNTIFFEPGDGQDIIESYEDHPDWNHHNTLQFGTGVAVDDVVTLRRGYDLVVSLAGTADQITVRSFFHGGPEHAHNPLQAIRFAQGLEWGLAEIVQDVASSNQVLNGTGGGDSILGGLGDDTLYGFGGNDTLNGGDGVDKMYGGTGDDTYVVDDTDEEMTEADSEGTDTVLSSAYYWMLGANFENLTLQGTGNFEGRGNAAANLIRGNAGNNLLVGYDGADTLDGGPGNDTMGGGAGDDTYFVDATGDLISESANQGTDTVISTVTRTLPNNMENLALSGTGNVNATGNAGDNVLTGNVGNNILTGGAGNDTYGFSVGGGNDTIVDTQGSNQLVFGAGILSSAVTAVRTGSTVKLSVSATDSVSFAETSAGHFSVQTVTFANGDSWSEANIRQKVNSLPTGTVTIVGDPAVGRTLTASNSLADADGVTAVSYKWQSMWPDPNWGPMVWTDIPGATNSTLVLGEAQRFKLVRAVGSFLDGRGTLEAVASNPTNSWVQGSFHTNSPPTGSVIISGQTVPGQTLAASHSLADPDGLGAISYQWQSSANGGSTWTDIWGAVSSTFALSQTQVGMQLRVAASYIDGFGFAESVASVATAVVAGSGVPMDIYGTAGPDSLAGTAGADRIVGLAGADTMAGGRGDDTYVVDSLWDFVVEDFDEGIDSIWVDFDYSLGSLFEVNSLATGSGTGALLGVGASAATPPSHFIAAGHPNIENLVLTGTAALGTGNELNNTLTGNANDNVLIGGFGADTMIGGMGNDRYFVDDVGDTVVETANQGTDTIESLVDYTLPPHVENLVLAGDQPVLGAGNALNNTLRGNGAGNELRGNGGNDTLDGGLQLGAVENLPPFELLASSPADDGAELQAAAESVGSAILAGGTGDDTYVFNRDYGANVVVEDDATPGNVDTAQFGPEVTAAQLWFRHLGDDLEVSFIGTTDSLTIRDWYQGSAHHVEQFKSSDGKMLLDSHVHSLVNAMAAFAPPALGQTTLPPNYQATLVPVIAANWV